jgi:hypothetical protein
VVSIAFLGYKKYTAKIIINTQIKSFIESETKVLRKGGSNSSNLSIGTWIWEYTESVDLNEKFETLEFILFLFFFIISLSLLFI